MFLPVDLCQGQERIATIRKKPARHRKLRRSGRVFRHKVYSMMLSKGKITEDLVNMLISWPPARRENLARYIIRAFLPSPASNREAGLLPGENDLPSRGV